MSDTIVAGLIKKACLLAVLDPKKLSGYSLRRSQPTTVGDQQLSHMNLMRQSRHKSLVTTLGYIECGDAWRNNIIEAVFGGSSGRS